MAILSTGVGAIDTKQRSLPKHSPSAKAIPSLPATLSAEPTASLVPAAPNSAELAKLRGMRRVKAWRTHWDSLAHDDLGRFAFEEMTGLTLWPGRQRPEVLSMPIAAIKSLPKLFPETFEKGDFSNFGFLPDPEDPDGLPVGLKVGGSKPKTVELTCAACHVGLYRGRVVSGVPNDRLRYGSFLLAWTDAMGDSRFNLDAVRQGATEAMGSVSPPDDTALAAWFESRPRTPVFSQLERQAILNWGAGRVSLRLRGGYSARIPALFGIGKRMMTAGTWNDLAERNKYVFALRGVPHAALSTVGAQKIFAAMSDHVSHLPVPEAPFIPRGLKLRGQALFYRDCAGCHDTMANESIPVEAVGTDAKLSREGSFSDWVQLRFSGIGGLDFQFWPRVRIPSLKAVATRRLLLHNGSVFSLAQLLEPQNRPPVLVHAGDRFDTKLPGNSNRGHDFGSDLEADDREALIAYLKSR